MKYVFNMVLVSKIKVPQSIAIDWGIQNDLLICVHFFSFLLYHDLEYIVGDLNSAVALLDNKD